MSKDPKKQRRSGKSEEIKQSVGEFARLVGGLPGSSFDGLPMEAGGHVLPCPILCLTRGAAKYIAKPSPQAPWRELTQGQVKDRLHSAGYSKTPIGPGELSPADRVLHEIEDRLSVEFDGELAGWAEGLHESNGMKFLVIKSNCMVEPVAGGWENFRAVLDGLFQVGSSPLGKTQFDVFCAWVKHAVLTLSSGHFSPGQCLVLAGPTNCGKSLLQTLITELLGGRSAEATRYLGGKSEFNADLARAEHLMLEDSSLSRDIRSRRILGEKIKQVTVNQQQSVHPKGNNAINLKLFWRLSFSVNNNDDALVTLPELHDDVRDKIIMLKCERFELPMRTETSSERERFLNELVGEIPAFLHFLIHEFELPEALRDKRFNVASWQHPELVASLNRHDPSERLLELIDDKWHNIAPPSRPTGYNSQPVPTEEVLLGAAELKGILHETSQSQVQAIAPGGHIDQFGILIGKLAKRHPDRVEGPIHKRGGNVWRLRRVKV